MPSNRWRVYYGDGTTFSDRDGSQYDAPATNVQIVAQESKDTPSGFTLTYAKDAYCWAEASWLGCDVLGMYDYLMNVSGPKKVLFGRSMERNEDFWAIVSRAGKEGLG